MVHVVDRKLKRAELKSVEATCVGGKDCDTGGVALDPPAGHIQPHLPHYQGLAGLGCFFPLFFPFFLPFFYPFLLPATLILPYTPIVPLLPARHTSC